MPAVHAGRRRRGGAGWIRIRPLARLIAAPARVCFSLDWPSAIARSSGRQQGSRSCRVPPEPSCPHAVDRAPEQPQANLLGQSAANARASIAAARRPRSVRSDSAQRRQPAPRPRHWRAPAARPAAPRFWHRPPSSARTGINARSRGRVNVRSRLVGSSAKPMPAASSVAISCALEISSSGRASRTPSRSLSARHRGKPGDTAAAKQPHQQRLGLIVAGMGGERHAWRRWRARPWPAAGSAPRARQLAIPVFGLVPVQRSVRCSMLERASRDA